MFERHCILFLLFVIFSLVLQSLGFRKADVTTENIYLLIAVLDEIGFRCRSSLQAFIIQQLFTKLSALRVLRKIS